MLTCANQSDAVSARHGIKGIDHPVIAVRDMEAARDVFRRLGFVVPPRGSHVEWGTGNWCIMFPKDYLELRGIVDPTRPIMGLDTVLESKGEGLMGIAFATDDAAKSGTLLQRDGIGVRKLISLARNFEHPAGWTQPSFNLCFPNEAEVADLTHVVLCEHETPELMRAPEFLAHPNGVTGVVKIVGVTGDLDRAEARQRRFLGDGAVQRSEDTLLLSLSERQQIRLVKPEAFRHIYHEDSLETPPEPPHLKAITLSVSDLAKTAIILMKNSVPFRTIQNPNRLRVCANYACGTIVEFVGS